MNDVPRRSDSWVQWALLLLTILTGVWSLGGRLASIEQQLKDNLAWQDIQAQRIANLEQEVIGLTKRVK